MDSILESQFRMDEDTILEEDVLVRSNQWSVCAFLVH